jgi:hypothetical protein
MSIFAYPSLAMAGYASLTAGLLGTFSGDLRRVIGCGVGVAVVGAVTSVAGGAFASLAAAYGTTKIVLACAGIGALIGGLTADYDHVAKIIGGALVGAAVPFIAVGLLKVCSVFINILGLISMAASRQKLNGYAIGMGPNGQMFPIAVFSPPQI